jgi:prepilin-type N-terminal cleavage/methylation domain-containing protein
MDVVEKGTREAGHQRPDAGVPAEVQFSRTQAGFTLIESVVAMALFLGIVFLLVSVFNEFLMDDYSSKLNKAFLIGENEIEKVESNHVFESVESDSIGFHVTQSVTMEKRVVLVDVAVRDTKKPNTVYIRLSKAFPVH